MRKADLLGQNNKDTRTKSNSADEMESTSEMLLIFMTLLSNLQLLEQSESNSKYKDFGSMAEMVSHLDMLLT